MSIKINLAIINNSYNKSISSVSFTSKIARSGNSVSEASTEVKPNIKITTKNVVPEALSTYVSDIKENSKDMMKTITDLYKNKSEGDEKEMYRSMKKFTECYNDIIDTNKEYSTDSGVKKLTKKLKSLVEDNKEELENIGITLKSNGKLVVNETKLLSVAEDGQLDEFLSSNKDSITKKSFMDEVRKISRKIYRDQTTFLSDKSKGILQNPIVTYKEVLESSESDNTSNSEGNAITDDNSNFTTLGINLDVNA